VNASDYNDFDWTPLHWTCYNGHVQVVKELREHGADTEATSLSLGMTPLHNAAIYGHLAVVIELLSPNDSSDGATTSILGKRKSRGADTEAKNRDGDTPLHLASLKGHFPL
jgi:ankyrin repeat protein